MIDWKWILVIIFIIGVFTRARIKKRGYFWKAKNGRELNFKQFMGLWKEGVVGITPLQQIKVSLWAFIPLYGGVLWGIAITFIGKTYWMCIILISSLPITSMQVISQLQKYFSIKKVEEVMKNLK